MKILNNDEIRSLEQQTVNDGLTTVHDMTERAGEAISHTMTERWDAETPVYVFAGWGGNGADALCTARHLAQEGRQVHVYLFNVKNTKLSTECRRQRDLLKTHGGDNVTLTEITGREPFTWPEIDSYNVIVDGLFGSGLKGKMPTSFQMIVKNINDTGSPIVAVDMPSGLHSDDNTGTSADNVINATLTLAETAPRPVFMFSDYARAVGEWRVVDVGVSAEALRDCPYTYYFMLPATVGTLLQHRGQFTSKADYGSALLCAGSTGMYGAAVLAAAGALRAGAGKVTVHSAANGMTVLQTAQPCAMFSADDNDDMITDMKDGLERYTAVAVGPGIGTHAATLAALEGLLKASNAAGRPLIVDADALNCIAEKPILLNYLPVLSVLTPHPGEFDRMFGESGSDSERLARALDIAAYHKVIIVLKGRFTAIVRPDGKVFFNASGTPAMATGGSGDVLTGVIAGLMAQGYKPEKASFMAVCIHGVAGQLAAAVHGEYGVTAMDIADNIGRAIKKIQR